MSAPISLRYFLLLWSMLVGYTFAGRAESWWLAGLGVLWGGFFLVLFDRHVYRHGFKAGLRWSQRDGR